MYFSKRKYIIIYVRNNICTHVYHTRKHTHTQTHTNRYTLGNDVGHELVVARYLAYNIYAHTRTFFLSVSLVLTLSHMHTHAHTYGGGGDVGQDLIVVG